MKLVTRPETVFNIFSKRRMKVMYKCSLERMSDKIRTFAKYGDAGHGGITRYSLSPEANMARAEFKKRMEAIGAKVECDDVACMYATIEGSDPNAKRIVMGSHCDSVKNGGNYDGNSRSNDGNGGS